MEQNKSVDKPSRKSTMVTFLVDKDHVQVHIFGDHSWHKKFRTKLKELGLDIHEQFCSPCG